MFSEPEVRYSSPELRAGDSHRLDHAISPGQQNVVMLMLLLKLADFAIDGDIHLQERMPLGASLMGNHAEAMALD
jgi:hypothetical protein